jgi:hypothetical protein
MPYALVLATVGSAHASPSCRLAPTGTLERSYRVRSQRDVEALACVTRLRGNLTVAKTGLVSLSLPSLTDLEGSITVTGNEGLQALVLDSLERATGDVRIERNASLTNIDLSSLEVVGQGLKLDGNAGLAQLDVDELRSVHGDLEVRASSLPAVTLPSLTTIGGSFLLVGPDSQLATVETPNLANIGRDLIVFGSDKLLALRLPALAEVGGRIEIRGHAALTEIALPALRHISGDASLMTQQVGKGLWIDSSASGLRLDFSGVRSIDGGLTLGPEDEVANLRSLETVQGDVRAFNKSNSQPRADLTRLRTVRGSVHFPFDAELPGLHSVGKDLILESQAVKRASLPGLEEIGGALSLDGTRADVAALPRLRRVGGMRMFNNGELTRLDLAALETIGQADIYDNPRLAHSDVEDLLRRAPPSHVGRLYGNGTRLGRARAPLVPLIRLRTLDWHPSHPQLVLFDDGRLIFLKGAWNGYGQVASDSSPYAGVRLSQAEQRDLQRLLRTDELLRLPARYHLSVASDQPMTFLELRRPDGTVKQIEVYGELPAAGDPALPAALLDSLRRLETFRHPNAKDWLPEEIQVHVRWPAKNEGGAALPWPSGWPDLNHPTTTRGHAGYYVLHFAPAYFGDVMRLLAGAKRVSINGADWDAYVSLPWPNEPLAR